MNTFPETSPIVFYAPDLDPRPWLTALEQALPPGTELAAWPELTHAPEAVRYLVFWGDPAPPLAALPRLRAVLALGAGVDKSLHAPLPAGCDLIRLVNAGMGHQMVEYALHWALHFQRDMDRYLSAVREGAWPEHPYRPAREVTCGILGLGTLGQEVARALRRQGYPVRGWSRTAKSVPGVDTFHGAEGLGPFLAGTELLFDLLPLTAETRHLLDATTLAKLPKNAVVVNMGRGGTVDGTALLHAVDRGALRAAVLDVTEPEPLPLDSPLRHHPRIFVTPHISAQTQPEPAARQVAESIAALDRGERPVGLVDRVRGY